jgi:tRNA U34 2-thiouridine synthase MnmA/TrmU
MTRKAVGLISGGLDSTVATQLMRDQGIEIQGLFFSMPWGCCDKEEAFRVARHFDIPMMVIKLNEDYLERVVKDPQYGYGTAMNPCVDCRIYMFRIAKQYMEQVGASFVYTGEVLGQRPMSQVKPRLQIIAEESGLVGRLLRPLSAKLLEPTLPEQEGVVDRGRLLDLCGRSRQAQMALADQYGITDYPQPAGGCLLTDQEFAKRVQDLLAHTEHPTLTDMELLRIGRQFRLSPATKLIVGRNEQENEWLAGYAGRGGVLCRPSGFLGPSALLAGEVTEAARRQAAEAILCYTKPERRNGHRIECVEAGGAVVVQAQRVPTPDELRPLRIG